MRNVAKIGKLRGQDKSAVEDNEAHLSKENRNQSEKSCKIRSHGKEVAVRSSLRETYQIIILLSNQETY